MIIMRFSEVPTKRAGSGKLCCYTLDATLGVFGVFCIYTLCTDADALWYSCPRYNLMVSLWIWSLLCTFGRNLTTLLILSTLCFNIKSVKIFRFVWFLYYFAFVMENLPGLVLFWIQLSKYTRCLDQFNDMYFVLGNVIIIQGWVCFMIVIFSIFRLLFTCLVWMLGDYEAWSQNTYERKPILEKEERHEYGPGYVIEDKHVYI